MQLLKKVLKSLEFDFNNPVYEQEPVVSPGPEMFLPDSDRFLFSLKLFSQTLIMLNGKGAIFGIKTVRPFVRTIVFF